jgi:peptide/nickel transport system permease protein
MTRSAALNVLNQPHILAARGNGIGTWRIHCIYALKAALVPILNLEGFLFGILVGSLVVVENVFSLPGLGRGVLSSFQNRDFLELNGQALVLTSVFILGNLIVDLLMPLVDPRVATN